MSSVAPTNILDLPEDVQIQIISYVPAEMSLLCSYFRELAVPVLYKHLSYPTLSVHNISRIMKLFNDKHEAIYRFGLMDADILTVGLDAITAAFKRMGISALVFHSVKKVTISGAMDLCKLLISREGPTENGIRDMQRMLDLMIFLRDDPLLTRFSHHIDAPNFYQMPQHIASLIHPHFTAAYLLNVANFNEAINFVMTAEQTALFFYIELLNRLEVLQHVTYIGFIHPINVIEAAATRKTLKSIHMVDSALDFHTLGAAIKAVHLRWDMFKRLEEVSFVEIPFSASGTAASLASLLKNLDRCRKFTLFPWFAFSAKIKFPATLTLPSIEEFNLVEGDWEEPESAIPECTYPEVVIVPNICRFQGSYEFFRRIRSLDAAQITHLSIEQPITSETCYKILQNCRLLTLFMMVLAIEENDKVEEALVGIMNKLSKAITHLIIRPANNTSFVPSWHLGSNLEWMSKLDLPALTLLDLSGFYGEGFGLQDSTWNMAHHILFDPARQILRATFPAMTGYCKRLL